MKNLWKSIGAGILLLCMLVMFPSTLAFAEEQETKILAAVSGLYLDVEVDLSEKTFTVSDLRTPEIEKTFNGGDGVPCIIFFGDVVSRGSVLGAIGSALEQVGTDSFNVYVFDRDKNPEESILAAIEGMSDHIIVTSEDNSYDYSRLFSTCYGGTVGWGNSYYSPLLFFKNAEGTVYAYASGSVGQSDIITALNAGEVTVDGEPIAYNPINVTYRTKQEITDYLKESGATVEEKLVI